jgi:hypothetical protein
MAFNGEGSSSGASRPSVTLDNAIVLAENGVLVLLDTRLPSGCKISMGGLAVSPVLEDGRLEALIEEHRAQLNDEQRADPSFMADNEL